METSSTGSSKRARAPANGSPVPLCLVDGCTSDLSKCRDYHRRHKVCEIHSKTAIVTVAGQQKRFCQQCSRFHSLEEFDEGKRSCRKRLEGHNRRRRKPQPEAMSVNSQDFLVTYQAGSRFTQSGQMFSASSIPTSAWAGIVKPENESMPYHSPSEINFIPEKDSLPLSNSYRGEKQFSFSQGNNPKLPGVSFCHPLQNSNFTSGLGGSSHNIFSDGLNRDIDTGRAHSLLSSPPPRTSEIGLGHVHEPLLNPAQTLVPSPNCLSLEMEGRSLQPPYPHGNSSSDINFQGISHVGSDGSSTRGAHQTISFSWG